MQGVDLSSYEVSRLYSPDRIQAYIDELVRGRRAYTEQIVAEGLIPEVLRLAEESFSIAPRRKQVVLSPPTEAVEKTPLVLRKPEFENRTVLSRLPRRSRFSGR